MNYEVGTYAFDKNVYFCCLCFFIIPFSFCHSREGGNPVLFK